ncbi:hypothetical protein [Vibrio parahaemolyticus]|uniref:hypothetical protein n=1 Tax=Vibrio parahaemolyticus TaxID=670 RepID=UPI002285B56B|nr:hypothetical protein [Vibrio parahaemolyticus]ELA9885251.1 hypothetical protein [Vibrio parahaemolyticus]
MAEKWLVERLTKSKQGSPQWVALAEALEEYWDTHFFNELQTFEDSKNIFTASEDHLNQKIAEFGDYFDTALPLDTSGKRLSISWQRANIHEKDTIVPFVNSLSVNFAGLGVTWEPLYSNKSLPYARDNLFTEQEVQIKKWDLNDFWMTSRGKIAVDLTHLHKLGMAKETFIAIAKREIERLRPAHIVYDGELFILTINFDYAPLSHHVERQTVGEKGGSMVYRLTASFDDRPADVPWLDDSPLYVEHRRGTTTSATDFVIGGMSWSLDLFVDLGGRRVPLAGKEGDIINALQEISSIERYIPVQYADLPLSGASLTATRYPCLNFSMHYHFDVVPADSIQTDANEPIHGQTRATLKSAVMSYQLGSDWSLDLFVSTPEGATPIAGKEGDRLPPMLHHRIQLRSFQTQVGPSNSSQKKQIQSFCSIAYSAQADCVVREFLTQPYELNQSAEINQNPWLGFDEIPADFAPLDTPLWK